LGEVVLPQRQQARLLGAASGMRPGYCRDGPDEAGE